MAIMRWLILACQFCTVLPTPTFCKEVTDTDIRKSTVFYPLIGLCIGALMWGLAHLIGGHAPSFMTAVVLIIVSTVVTGGLHLDGLMDTFDALGSRQPSTHALEIMRDSRVGAMGVLAGCFAVILKVAAVSALLQTHAPLCTFLFVPAFSRAALVLSMNLAPYARQSTGLGAMFAQQVPRWVVLSAFVWPLLVMVLSHAYLFAIGLGVMAIALAYLTSSYCRHRFGGMTGDTYGALHELVETVGWCISVLY